jgi:O-antigen ligase
MGQSPDDNKDRTSGLLSIPIYLWIALIGADRIDLLNGSGPFILTPFLVLSPPIILAGVSWLLCRRPDSSLSFKVSRRLIPLFFSITAFLIAILLSIIFGADVELGIKRYILLLLDLVFCSSMLIILNKLKNPAKTLVIGSYMGIAICALFCIAQFQNWPTDTFGAVPFLDLTSPSIGVFAPRLSGVSIDPNRGGLLIIVYSFLIMKFAVPSKVRTASLVVAAVLLLLTLSKSAIASCVVLVLVRTLQKPEWLGPRKRAIKYFVVVVIVVIPLAFYFVDYLQRESAINIEEVLTERLSASDETSGGIHLALVAKGFDLVLSHAKILFLGIGFGASHTVLNDFFPDNNYANFHSIYISLLVEGGIFSLLLFLFIYFYPVLGRRHYLPLILALACFNLFYQLILEPVFWLCILLFWNNFGFKQRELQT